MPSPKQPPLLRRSGLTQRVWVLTRYKHLSNGTIEVFEKHDVTDEFNALTGASHKVEQPRAATVDIDPQDAAASLGELSLPAEDGAGLPVTGATEEGKP